MRREHRDAGLVVVGVTRADRAAAETFSIRHGADYPILCDADAVFSDWGVRAVPAMFLRDPDGVVVAQGLGNVTVALDGLQAR